MHEQKKNIVILGAGFAGLQTALRLSKKLRSSDYHLLLIDERDTHIYTPDLYEIATAFNEEINEECLMRLKDTVAIPYAKIFASHRGKGHIEFIRDRVTEFAPDKNKVLLKNHGVINYEYLVVALGSVVNYYDIPGLKEYAYPFKTVTDALAINCHIDMHIHRLWKEKQEKDIAIIVGGGGATGVEFSAELYGDIDKICKKYRYPRNRVGITIIEGGEQLAGQEKRATDIIKKRLQHIGISVLFETYIKKVEQDAVHTESKHGGFKKIPASILVWTGGVRPHPFIESNFAYPAKNGGLPVNAFLQHEIFVNIYAAGDNAYFVDSKSGKIAPLLAQIAFQQGKLVARNIMAAIKGRAQKPYHVRIKGIIIPLGGMYAILVKNNFVLRGFFIWVLRRLVDLFYACSILPFRYAVKKWIHDTHIFIKND